MRARSRGCSRGLAKMTSTGLLAKLTLFPCGFHVAKRSDAIKAFPAFIRKMRADTELRCPNF